MIFISRHSNLENFIQIDQKLLELWSLEASHLGRPRLQDFFKKIKCEQLCSSRQ